ncbi:DUF433 domain-containing protein [Ferrovibrio sp.]|uniref:DUF433 domain-containing protein n=1 Tax=Ferrovibrio sp. TaxID=1917215 RepID=UPI000CB0E491|nr:MAG: hypothetical protein CTR53_05155 [Ferrovibrio sp.]
MHSDASQEKISDRWYLDDRGTSSKVSESSRLKNSRFSTVMAWYDPYIVSDPGIHSGAPVIKGTRVTADIIAASVNAGIPMARILKAYNWLSEIQVKAAVDYCRDHPSAPRQLKPLDGIAPIKVSVVVCRKK